MRIAAVLLLVGCQTSYIRYVGSKTSPDEARMQVAAKAMAAGWKPQKRPVATSLVEVGDVRHPEAVADVPTTEPAKLDAPSEPTLSPDGIDRYWTTHGKLMATARAMPLETGSLLEVSSKSVAMLDRVSSGGDRSGRRAHASSTWTITAPTCTCSERHARRTRPRSGHPT
jgi:hypothetical protein